jgi:cleavage and polyadenylation specificity factor subunit 1
LKAAIICHGDQQWTEALPLVLLVILISYKADLQASVADLVNGESLRISGDLFTPVAGLAEPEYLFTHLRDFIILIILGEEYKS